jgi:anti-anti-sigma factor
LATSLNALVEPLSVESEESGDARVVRFRRVEILCDQNVREMGEGLETVLSRRERPGRVVIDLAGIQILSSAAVAKLILFQRRLRGLGGELLLCHLHPHVARSFQLSNLSHYFSIHADVNAALASPPEAYRGARTAGR